MSYEVYFYFKNKNDYKKLDAEFRKIHNMDFYIDCNFRFENGKFVGYDKNVRCEHEIGGTKPLFNNGRYFDAIPCHWDYEHMVQTEKDIREAALRANVELIKTNISW